MSSWNKGLKGVQKAWNKGLPKEQQPYFNRTMSDETKRKISEAQKGKPRPKGSGMSGKRHSEETKRKISETKKMGVI